MLFAQFWEGQQDYDFFVFKYTHDFLLQISSLCLIEKWRDFGNQELVNIKFNSYSFVFNQNIKHLEAYFIINLKFIL